MKRASPLMVGIVLLALIVFACDDAAVVAPEPSPNTTVSDEPTTSVDRPASCESSGGESWSNEGSASLELLGQEGDLSIYAAEYPLPGPTEGLWTQWGQGIALGDGRHMSAVGDHLGVDGNSWFYLYDDANRSLTRIFDVLSVVPHEEGAGGYGKMLSWWPTSVARSGRPPIGEVGATSPTGTDTMAIAFSRSTPPPGPY